ncbi:hypothetical protein IF1G_04024 [Cordyceps javanica]|uniref:Uncharacterized protein n=1 Tax=Cordyceps javanica TaxID=43265 RepID=A0A545V502_9HYPO|nr:hypothetical protein IF1G_04024 [Cordyceps javanica]TQW08051.1 hypothetical protein IF2G_03927 [Cordyceps javanica]
MGLRWGGGVAADSRDMATGSTVPSQCCNLKQKRGRGVTTLVRGVVLQNKWCMGESWVVLSPMVGGGSAVQTRLRPSGYEWPSTAGSQVF